MRLLDRIALRFSYVPVEHMRECQQQLEALRSVSVEAVAAHREYVAAANEAIGLLMFCKDARAAIKRADKLDGFTEAKIIDIDRYRS